MCRSLLLDILQIHQGLLGFIGRPNVRQVIHWGPPDDIEMYVQETGRAGCDGLPACAVMYYSSRDISESIVARASSSIKNYCRNYIQEGST